MADTYRNNKYRVFFYLLWLAISIIQAANTELIADEAYYWKYAQDLQWGYFDHPPVVAALIKPGYWLFQNELGVRLLFVLSGVGFLYLLERLVQPNNLLRYYMAVSSIAIFHFLSFLALPDMPLLLFSVSFLYLYKRYLSTDGWMVSLLLAANATLLLLSKYHGILLIGFIILSNPTLLKRKTFWLLALLSLNLFIPHIQWQVAHDFPSLKYHLYERSGGSYQFDFTLNYLLSVLLVFSPVMGLVLAWYTLKSPTRAYSFERSLKMFFAGTLIFFLLMTFKGRAEANWIAPALIPAVILGYKRCEEREWFPKFTKYAFGISLLLILCARAYLAYDFLPEHGVFADIKDKLHRTKSWAHEVHQQAGDRPVVFMNKYQYAALYEFYTGRAAISLNNRMGRKNQYNIWDDEQKLQGKEVMVVPNFEAAWLEYLYTGKGKLQYGYISNFRSASFIKILPEQRNITADAGAEIELKYKVISTDSTCDLNNNQAFPPIFHVLLFQQGEPVSDIPTDTYLFNSMINDGQVYTIRYKAPEQPGTYLLYLDVAMGWLPSSINAEKTTLTVQ